VAHGELCHVIIPQDGMVLVSDIKELHCSHREADTRMFLHASYISKSGGNSIMSPDINFKSWGLPALLPHWERWESATDSSPGYCATSWSYWLPSIALLVVTVSSFYSEVKTKAIKLITATPTLCSPFQSPGESFTVIEDIVSDLEVFVCKRYGQ